MTATSKLAVVSNGHGKVEPWASKKGYILDIGCGSQKHPGAVGMDRLDLPGVDVIHNWNSFPWPFEDQSALTILARHVVEHVSPVDGHFLDWMDECWRILKPEGQLILALPYGICSLYVQDPTHCNPCNEKTWQYFDPLETEQVGDMVFTYYENYRPKPWKIEANFFRSEGTMEVVLRRREEDPDSWQ